MPKRNSIAADMGVGDMTFDKVQKKTERSHEENQERAYIAASRRADRSIEARVQSARMASEIHKKRTGKGFKISEEIVMKEEMYEEEDDELPRHYRMLASHLQTGNPYMNSRVNAMLTHRVAMASMAAMTAAEKRQNDVEEMFAASFPQYASMQMPNSAYYQGMQQSQQQASPTTPTSQHSSSLRRSREASNAGSTHSPIMSYQLSPQTTKAEDAGSPPPLSVGAADTPKSRTSPTFSHHDFSNATVPYQSSYDLASMPPSSSPFTSELPQDAMQFMPPGLDSKDMFAGYSNDTFNWNLMEADFNDTSNMDYYMQSLQSPHADTTIFGGDDSGDATPSDESWREFLNGDTTDELMAP